MIDVRNVPIRSTFVSRAVGKCWRRARLEIEQPPDKSPHYFLGGIVFALMVEQAYLMPVPEDPYEFAALCLTLALRERDYDCTEDQRNTIIRRCAEVWPEFKDWVATSGFTIMGIEVEVRTETSGGRDAAIKIDVLATKDQDVYLLDIKTFGLWGKSVSASPITEQQLRQSVQLSMYAYFLERGGEIYIGESIGRTETNAQVRARCTPKSGRLRPDYIGYINIAMLTRRLRDSKNGKAGERRGNPLQVLAYDPSMQEYAKEQLDAVELMMTFNQWPRTQRFERGQSSCGGCPYTNDCWSGRVNPGNVPSWLNRSK